MSTGKPQASAFQSMLDAAGVCAEVVEFPASTRTAADAAAAIGCAVAAIAKSIVFRAQSSGSGVLVIASGVNRIDELLIARALGEDIAKADADFVRKVTGYAIGGVPPCAHAAALPVFIDRELMALDVLWAAAGSPLAVFRLTPAQLLALSGGRVIDVK